MKKYVDNFMQYRFLLSELRMNRSALSRLLGGMQRAGELELRRGYIRLLNNR